MSGIARVEALPVAPRWLFVRIETDDGLVVLLTLALDGSTTLSAAHDEATVVAERIRAALPGVLDVVVHTEP